MRKLDELLDLFAFFHKLLSSWAPMVLMSSQIKCISRRIYAINGGLYYNRLIVLVIFDIVCDIRKGKKGTKLGIFAG